MASKKLYMESIEAGYLRDFSAEVIAVEDNAVTLDQTLFYPIGGGQNWDTGTISWDSGKVTVTEVRGRGDVQHFVGEDHGIEVEILLKAQSTGTGAMLTCACIRRNTLLAGWFTRCLMEQEPSAIRSIQIAPVSILTLSNLQMK